MIGRLRLTADEWYRLELLLPLATDVDLIQVITLLRGSMALLHGMLDRLVHELGPQCVEHINANGNAAPI